MPAEQNQRVIIGCGINFSRVIENINLNINNKLSKKDSYIPVAKEIGIGEYIDKAAN